MITPEIETSEYDSTSISTTEKIRMLGLNEEELDDLYTRMRGNFQKEKTLGMSNSEPDPLDTLERKEYYTLGSFPGDS